MMIEVEYLSPNKLMVEVKVTDKEVLGMAVDTKAATKAARQLYETIHSIKESKRTGQIATDLDQLIKNLQVKVFEIDMKELGDVADDVEINESTSGFLIKANENYTIYLNKNDPMTRKRFTIAHEMGHLKLNHVENIICRDSISSLGTDENEVKANAFAAELLMPEELMDYAYKLLKSVYRVARVFGVSEDAARIRLTKLGVINNEF